MQDSNLRSPAPKAGALATGPISVVIIIYDVVLSTLLIYYNILFYFCQIKFLEGMVGIEPTTKKLTASRSATELQTLEWDRLELNQRHMDFQSTALPTELRTRKWNRWELNPCYPVLHAGALPTELQFHDNLSYLPSKLSWR